MNRWRIHLASETETTRREYRFYIFEFYNTHIVTLMECWLVLAI